jgi:hypothetical protein
MNVDSFSLRSITKLDLLVVNLFDTDLTCFNTSLVNALVDCSVNPSVSSVVKSSGKNTGFFVRHAIDSIFDSV